jgi:hypothetical protein
MTSVQEVLTHNCINVSVSTYSYRTVQLIQLLCYRLDILAFYCQQVQVSVLKHPDHLWGPPSIVFSGYQGSFLGGEKETWYEANHLPASTAGVRNEWRCTSTPPTFPQGIDRDFTCTLLPQDYSKKMQSSLL